MILANGAPHLSKPCPAVDNACLGSNHAHLGRLAQIKGQQRPAQAADAAQQRDNRDGRQDAEIAFRPGPRLHDQTPDRQLVIAFDISIAPTFLEPAETPGIGTPFVFLYALHDALIKPLPGNNMAPCLAEFRKEIADGLVYGVCVRFVLARAGRILSRSTAPELPAPPGSCPRLISSRWVRRVSSDNR